MNRKTHRWTSIGVDGLEDRKLMAGTFLAPAEIRAFNPQPDPPVGARFPASFIPVEQLQDPAASTESGTQAPSSPDDLAFSWGE